MGLFSENFAKGLRPIQKISVAENAEKYINNPSNGVEGGKYSLSRAPYQFFILEALTSDNGITEVNWMAGAQLGKTYVALLWIAYLMMVDPTNILVYQPTQELAEAFSAQKLGPFFDNNPGLREMIKQDKVLRKAFKKFLIDLKGSNSGNSFRMLSSSKIFNDEIDSYIDIPGEGDPLDLIDARTSVFGKRKKIFNTSTPLISGLSRIERKFLAGDQNYFYVPCPHCQSYQKLVISNLKYDIKSNESGQIFVIEDSIYYECEICNAKIKEHEKLGMMLKGKMIPSNPSAPKHIKSFQTSSIYAPPGMYSWLELLQQYIEAKDDPFKLQVFYNVRLGEPYCPKAMQPAYNLLARRKEKYKFGELPKNIVALFAAIDTQDNRLEALVVGIAKAGEIYIVDHIISVGKPSKQGTWEYIDKQLTKAYKHELGFNMYVNSVFVDSGGHYASDVYNFVRKHQNYYAIKGSSNDFDGFIKRGNDIEKDPVTNIPFKPIPLFLINSSAIKVYIYTALNDMLETPEVLEGEKIIHFSDDCQDEFFKQLTSEKMMKVNNRGIIKNVWVKDRARNEVLDLLVYCLANAFSKNLMNITEIEHYNLIINLIKNNNVPFPSYFDKNGNNGDVEVLKVSSKEVESDIKKEDIKQNYKIVRVSRNNGWRR